MAFFTTAFHILILALAVGFLVSIVVFVPLTVYIIPFCLWVGFQNNRGKYKELKEGSVFRMAANATVLYRSWIFHKTPVFR